MYRKKLRELSSLKIINEVFVVIKTKEMSVLVLTFAVYFLISCITYIYLYLLGYFDSLVG